MNLALNKCFSFTVWWRGRGGRWWGKTTKKLPHDTRAYILEVVDWSCPVLCVQEGEEEADEENDPDYDPKVREHVPLKISGAVRKDLTQQFSTLLAQDFLT